jgi:hypothetical protein
MASLNFSYSLQNNQVADATHVMANFTNVKTFVEASAVQVDGSVQAGTAAIANDAVTAAKLAPALPKGVIAKETKTSNSATGTNVNCFTGISFTPVVGRLYRISFSGFVIWNISDFSSTAEVVFVDSSNNTLQTISQVGASIGSLADSFLLAPATATPVTLNVRLNRTSGTDTYYFSGSATKQNYILIEDIGLA